MRHTGSSHRCAAVLAAIATAAAGAVGFERWARTTRATREEARKPLPGDELVPAPRWQLTRAVTIAGPPREVWPWLVQMGYPQHRAGWYAPYWLDRLVWHIKYRSADEIVPQLQELSVGDRIPDSPDGSTFFEVERLEPRRSLVLLSTTHPLPPYTDVRFGWAFVLEDRGDATRLLLRARLDYRPLWPAALVWVLFRTVMSLGDVVEAGAMLRGIRDRVERAARRA